MRLQYKHTNKSNKHSNQCLIFALKTPDTIIKITLKKTDLFST